ncbi:MAG: aldo/keto reductase [Bacteroidota bacterium]
MDNGVLDVVLKAKQEGKVRHIGFTGHTTTEGHRAMVRQAGNELETCQMPANVLDPTYSSFIREVLPELRTNNFGVIAMKTLAGGSFSRLYSSKCLGFKVSRYSMWFSLKPQGLILSNAPSSRFSFLVIRLS